MDIEQFDRLYPLPAHAAVADLRNRYAPKNLQPQARILAADRAGIAIGVAALTAASWAIAEWLEWKGKWTGGFWDEF